MEKCTLGLRFGADFPDEAEWTSGGSLNTPNGRSLARAICELLHGRGYECSGVDQLEYYAWQFFTRKDDVVYRVWVQDMVPWLLCAEARLPFWRRASALELQSRFIEKCADILKHDDRFHEVRLEEGVP